ncbi:MFS transporter [Acinetobacter pittii]
MMHKIESKRGMLALMTSHCAGMVDLVALPIWIGTLIANYHFGFQQAGGLVTLFLLGAMLASLIFAPIFNRFNPKWPVFIGFLSACCAFYLASKNTHFSVLAILHLVGGFSAGLALSFTHGTMGRSINPHRIFGFAGLALGIFAILFLTGSLNLIRNFGGSTLFMILASIMAVAAFIAFLFYPQVNKKQDNIQFESYHRPKFSKYIWCCIFGISLLAMTNSMNVSFYERIGIARGFGESSVALTLIIYGIVSIFPAPIAAFTQKYFNPLAVICIGPIFQAIFSLVLTHSHNYFLYTVAGSCMVFTILFTHTYAFGLLARLEPTGRAVAGTPAMLMFGAALGPILAGTLVQYISFEAIGIMGCILVVGQLILFNMVRAYYTNHGIAQNA